MKCPACHQEDNHKFSCYYAEAFGLATVNWDEERTSGYAVVVIERGGSQQQAFFDAPLISHIEGNLYMGGCKQGVDIADEFQTVVSLFPWEQYTIADGVERHEYRMHDSSDGVDFYDLMDASDKVLAGLEKGKTLVHCQAGLNRSGLVAAFSMMRLGKSAQQAIDMLRLRRDRLVLCNDTFVEQLHGLEHNREEWQ